MESDMTAMNNAMSSARETSAWLRANGHGHQADELDKDCDAIYSEVTEINTKVDAYLARQRRGFWAKLFG